MAGIIRITYGGTQVSFTNFSGEDLPSSVLGEASLEFSQIGTGYSLGPARRQRSIWAIATFATAAQISLLNTIFTGWDSARAASSNTSLVSIYDDLLRERTGNNSIPAISAQAFFTTPPQISTVGGSNEIFLLTFGLTEA